MSSSILGTIVLTLIVLVILVVVAVYILRWLYRRSTKETAFVRTGFLGERVVVNGGAFVIPVLHEITPVNMNVLRIEVRRAEHGALITRNRMRVDIAAQFFVRVGASPEAVAVAAQTLGRRTLQEDGIRSHVRKLGKSRGQTGRRGVLMTGEPDKPDAVTEAGPSLEVP